MSLLVEIVPLSTSTLTQTNPVADGDQFTIDDGTNLVTFEFDSAAPVVTGTATLRAVTIAADSTPNEIATVIMAAITGAQTAASLDASS